jgi:hypothetical protein
VSATFQVADAIILLATLSFLGFGLPPPAATWGGMLSQGTTYLLDGYWWQVYPAGLLIMLTVIAFNLIGDALRSSLDRAAVGAIVHGSAGRHTAALEKTTPSHLRGHAGAPASTTTCTPLGRRTRRVLAQAVEASAAFTVGDVGAGCHRCAGAVA